MRLTVDDFGLKLVINKVDKFEYEDADDVDPQVENYTVSVGYTINGSDVDAHGSYYMVRDMLKYGIGKLGKLYSEWKLHPYGFEIFTCTCGYAGCAGLSIPIAVKERRHTIEWRVPMAKCPAYKFLDKTFYTFASPMVYSEIQKVVDEFEKFAADHPDARFDVI